MSLPTIEKKKVCIKLRQKLAIAKKINQMQISFVYSSKSGRFGYPSTVIIFPKNIAIIGKIVPFIKAIIIPKKK